MEHGRKPFESKQIRCSKSIGGEKILDPALLIHITVSLGHGKNATLCLDLDHLTGHMAVIRFENCIDLLITPYGDQQMNAKDRGDMGEIGFSDLLSLVGSKLRNE